MKASADEAELLAHDGARKELELTSPRDPNVRKDKADEPPVWVVPAGSQA